MREFERHAQLMLSKNAFDYYASGANDMVTLRENRQVITPGVRSVCSAAPLLAGMATNVFDKTCSFDGRSPSQESEWQHALRGLPLRAPWPRGAIPITVQGTVHVVKRRQVTCIVAAFFFSVNRSAYNRLRLRPRILRDVSKVDTSTYVLGEKVASPICIAPTGECPLSFSMLCYLSSFSPPGLLACLRAVLHGRTNFH